MKHSAEFVLAGLAALSLGIYLLTSAGGYGPGFPLDDAWIHQSYARNLAARGEWAFLPDQPSAGATSFLWVLLLAPGHLLGLAPFGWTFLLGGLLLWAISLTIWGAAKSLFAAGSRWPLFVAGLLLFEWHLAWAAASGMETLLFAWLATLALTRILSVGAAARMAPSYWWWNGLLLGAASLARPEGFTLLAPLGLAAILSMPDWRKRTQALGQMLLAFALFFLPYLLLNRALSGNVWPNTFYAKQAEYAALLGRPLTARVLEQFATPLMGAGVLMLPGFLACIYRAARRRNWALLLGAAWVIGFLALYALRLPVSFQHGRYAIPVIPAYFLLGAWGTFPWIDLGAKSFWPRVLGRVGVGALIALLIAFFGLGAGSYSQDVAFIQTEMVVSAKWVQEHTDKNALIAAHDIGALGYFSQRPLLDLAGLVSPEVIPFLRDEKRLALYLDAQSADYLLTFPGWYPSLVEQGELVFQTQGEVSPPLGGENMALYRWIGALSD